MKSRALLVGAVLALTGIGGATRADLSGVLIPRRTWLDDARDREETAYAAAAIQGQGVVVAGNAGVLRYSIHGDLVWSADYAGTGYGVTIGPEGQIVVAGTAGVACLTPDGEPLWRVAGAFRDAATALGGTLLILEETMLSILDSDGTVLTSIPYPGSATSIATANERVVVGGSAGASSFDLRTGRLLWTAPYPGHIEDVALDNHGNLYVVGSAGVHAYDGRGAFLWEREFPGEAQAVSVFSVGKDDPWILVGGTTHHLSRARLKVIALTPAGEAVWESLEGTPDEECFGYGLASDPLAVCFYAVGASRRVDPEPLPSCYRTIQYAPTLLSAAGAGCRAPLVSFELDDLAPAAGQGLTFRNLSQEREGHLVAWVWEFGDGQTSRAWAPIHTYTRPGTYTVTLTAFNDQMCGTSASATVRVQARPPVVQAVHTEAPLKADFIWTVDPEVYGDYPEGFEPDGPTALDEVQFVDRSGSGPVVLRAQAASPDGAIVRYQWDLTFDGQFDTEGETVAWSFGAPGVYPATLVVTCEHGKTSVHEFFVDTTGLGPVSWSWTFGDGGNSDLQHPGHRYRRWGAYEVSLTVVDAWGHTDTARQLLTVVNIPPVTSFAWEAEAGEGELEAAFTWTAEREVRGSYPVGFDPGDSPTTLDVLWFEDRSTGGALTNVVHFSADAWDVDGDIVGWSWEFGDGATSDDPNPTHTYSDAGSYTVRLTVTDSAGDTATHTAVVDVQSGAGAITAWWWEFGDGDASELQHPHHGYDRGMVYGVSLTVFDDWSNSAMAEDWIVVLNVPPVAAFTWTLDPPELPPCEWILGGCEGGETSGCFCADPVVPENAGTLRLDGTASRDSEPWLGLGSWEWWFGFDGQADCLEDCDGLAPLYRLTWQEGAYYRGIVDVTLLVWDDDGAGGWDFVSSEVTERITLDNIPPYAGFTWSLGQSWTDFSCESCADAYGEGDAYVETTVGTVTVSRLVSGICPGWAAILAPWETTSVELSLGGSGTEQVTLTETVPTGWTYGIRWRPDCVTIVEEGEGYFVLAVDLASCVAGRAWISYALTPPSGPVGPGRYLIEGSVEVRDTTDDPETGDLQSELVLCTIVNVLADLDLYGSTWDPNGDEVETWAWILQGDGESWEFSDPGWVWAPLDLYGLVAVWDDAWGEWVWSYVLDPASLTVTDSGGASTTVTGIIPLRGTVRSGGGD